MASIFAEIHAHTRHDLHAWCLPNIRGEGKERSKKGRDQNLLENFSKKHDAPGFAQFFCTSTIEHRAPRRKEYACEALFLFADVDAKDISLTKEQIRTNLFGLELVPSRIHDTGNGFHVLWRLSVPVLLQERNNLAVFETLLKRIANHIGGDLSVAHCVALLRVPGTHNSKRGEWHRVTVLREGSEVYSLAQIDQWLNRSRQPVMVRRDRQTNPFLRVAEEQSFRAPVDVEQRLKDMEFKGAGENGVHATLLSVSAALVVQDWDEDQIIAFIMPVLQRLRGTEDWNWAREERTLRTMIQDFERKVQRERRRRATLSAAAVPPDDNDNGGDDGDADDNVVSLKLAKAKLQKTSGPKKPAEHIVLGGGILAALKQEQCRLMYTEKLAWLCESGIWTAMDDDEHKDWAARLTEGGCRDLGIASTSKIVNETRAWLERNPDLYERNVPWDDHGEDCIATRSGIVCVGDGTIEPLRPDDYAASVIDCEYLPGADCPIWKRMLKSDYRLDDETILFLQEFAGTCLIMNKPRDLMRALVLLGQSNTGKSNILYVIAGLISKHVNATPMQALEGAHGLMQFLKPHPWVLHEAFEQSRWEMSATAKALLSGDPVHVNIKNGPLVALSFRQAIMWGTNVAPQFKEASKAMANRLVIIKMHRAFDTDNPSGLALDALRAGLKRPADLVLRDEKPGVLNWAIEGLKRALDRGYFKLTPDMRSSLHAMRTDSNIALGFIEACVEYTPYGYVSLADFYGAYDTWWRDNKTGPVPPQESLSKAIGSLNDGRLLTGKKIGGLRIYAGVKLNEEGLDSWNGYQQSMRAMQTGRRGVSELDSQVNRTLGSEHFQDEKFQAMREAHRTFRPTGEEN